MGLLFARVLAASGMDVVHVDPARAARHRAAQGISKSDRAGARLIAAMTLAGLARPVVASSLEAEALRVVAHAHRAGLMRIWPAAVAAWPASVGGLRSSQARAVLAAGPTPRAAARLDRTTLAALLSAAGCKRTVQDEAERLCMIFHRPELRCGNGAHGPARLAGPAAFMGGRAYPQGASFELNDAPVDG
ncbi:MULTISPECIES: hypothetical protein [unclassified Streptomyces]|uniref:hypothetical protein n=1 Tax=unclassified Streptomyces TaxID=2593676 RepID=UPI000DAC3F76|nr:MULTISPECIES: hypothetical protein [unclassified Streptomyces]PZT77600.1 hypothetical protein DNK56_31050 [Streptomyces sp. AC1-42W]PZT78447.1 hypothetical protein DNK55_01635 [Streptomyces sp. AC1-42T]